MRTIGVHGFCFDPASITNNPRPLFDAWASMLKRPVEPFTYYSYPIGFAGFARAVGEGYVGEYHAAFERAAPEAASRLLAQIISAKTPVDIVAHSLGTRVVSFVLGSVNPGVVRRVLLLEGAELQPNVPRSLPKGTEVLNVLSRDDLVLKDLGSVFNGQKFSPCIGHSGLGRKMDGWTDLDLTDKEIRIAAEKECGWDLDGSPKGTGLRALGGHWRAYEDPKNAPAYRSWLDGDAFDWMKRAG